MNSKDFLPLTRGSAWFLEKKTLANPNQWNLNLLVEVQQPVSPHLLTKAVQYLLNYHEGLRLRFVKDDTSVWRQYIAEAEEADPIQWIDLTHFPEEEQLQRIEEIAAESQTSLNLLEGPLQRTIYFDRGAQRPGLLFWAIHHILNDAFSNYVLFQSLNQVYEQLVQGKEINLGKKKTSLRTYTERLETYAKSEELRQELDNYWLQLPWEKCVTLPFDTPEGLDNNTNASERFVTVSLDMDELVALQRYVLRTGVQIIEVLATTVVQTLSKWSKSSVQCIGIQNHARMIFPDLDLTALIGFLSVAPCFLFSIEGASSPGDALQMVKQQYRRIPNQGNGCMALWCLNNDPKIVEKLQRVPFDYAVEINYFSIAPTASSSLIRYPQSFAGSTGNEIGTLESRNAKGMISCSVVKEPDKVSIYWYYSQNLYSHSTMEAFAKDHVTAIRELIHYYQNLL